MNEPIVLAIIGCGRIARFGHGNALKHLAEEGLIRVKYACDIIPGKADAYRHDFPECEQAIEDYHIALTDPEVKAFYVLTPNYAHYQITMDALKAGKDVFCEKPVTVNYELSKAMKEEADAKNRLLQIGVCNRYKATIEAIQKIIAEGKLGDVYNVVCNFRCFRQIPGIGGAFTDKSQSGGGVLIDWGVHFFDLILYCLGGAKVETVTADTYQGVGKNMKEYHYRTMWAEDTKDVEHGVNDVEDYVTGYIRTNKASITFMGAWANNIDDDNMFIDFIGTKGGIRLDYYGGFTYWNGDTLKGEKWDHTIPDMYECEDRAFIQSLHDRKKNKGNVDEVLETMKLLEAIYHSSDIHQELSFREGE
ncbi:MAG: Gfo/Idh/MocA family oxidoreductase [Erysipelotrichaceae bacterium]|nr:Gfo/Idh/MocA family oxidoreductase [Erysipelotrichaceae bacterium]